MVGWFGCFPLVCMICFFVYLFADEVVKNDSTLFEQSIDTIIPGVPKKSK